ncbi:MAG TPA: MBL fold metallo-hydrolase [Chthoniobacteraceae bacterium]|nr:MBL fold metallo-hydrolase [Chthoniobacteraceae bacterium]
MSQPHVFTITYWGTTGTFCDPLLPRQVSEKIVEAIARLVERGRLANLQPGADLRATVGRLLEQEVPFANRSTYGGNTTCVEVQTPDELLILDCGSGFRELGQALDARWEAEGQTAKRSAHVLLTHSHIDHTFATPYFTPYYDRRNSFTINGPQVTLDSLTTVLDPKSALSQVYFPPTYSEMKGIRQFRPIEPGADLKIGDTRITTMALNHPGGSMAYRFENSGRVFVFATDHEQANGSDLALTAFSRGADLLYTEGQFKGAEYLGETGIDGERPMSHQGWGHSPVEVCVATAVAAGVRRLHLGHRDPRRTDQQIAAFENYARQLLEREGDQHCELLIPYEGLQIQI